MEARIIKELTGFISGEYSIEYKTAKIAEIFRMKRETVGIHTKSNIILLDEGKN